MPTRVNFNLSAEARRGLDAVEVEMTHVGLEIEKHAAQYLDDNKINMEGDVKENLYHEIERFQNLIRLKAGSNAAHAPFVHFGTRPHWPPTAWKDGKPPPLVRWAKKKFGLTDQDAKRVGFLVARKIARDGTEAKPFMDHALAQVAGRFAERMGAAFIRGMG